MSVVKSIIKLHKMAPHPEGGYYAEVYKSKEGPAVTKTQLINKNKI